METVDRTLRYLFVLAFALIVLAYYAGANKLLGTAFKGTTALDYAATGRDTSGKFAGYPTGGP